MKVFLTVRGPSVIDLASYLAREHGWIIHEQEQTHTFKGYIIAEHDDPFDFSAVGINDGTFVAYVENLDEEEDNEELKE